MDPTIAPCIGYVICCYNAETTIQSCLEAIFHTPYPYRISLIDDGSKDRAYDVARRSAASSPHVLIRRSEKNLGCSKARNLSREALLATFPEVTHLCYLDADAYLRSKALTSLICATNTPDLIIAAPHQRTSRGLLSPERPLPTVRSKLASFLDLPEPATHGTYLMSACLLMARHTADVAPAFDERYRYAPEDVVFSETARARGIRLVTVAEAIHHNPRRLAHTSPRFFIRHAAGLLRYFANCHR